MRALFLPTAEGEAGLKRPVSSHMVPGSLPNERRDLKETSEKRHKSKCLKCGRSSMAERKLPKLHTRVRFPFARSIKLRFLQ